MAVVRRKNITKLKEWIAESQRQNNGEFGDKQEVEVIRKMMDTMGLTRAKCHEYLDYVFDRNPKIE